MTKTSAPRTFFSILQKISPLANLTICGSTSETSRNSEMFLDSSGLDVPETRTMRFKRAPKKFGWGGRIRTCEWQNQNLLTYRLSTPQESLHIDGLKIPSKYTILIALLQEMILSKIFFY